MIRLSEISLTQFRNYLFRQFQFSERIIGICGQNGTGKTNLLDAVYFLCFTKSYFPKTDSQSAFSKLAGFRIDGTVQHSQKQIKLTCHHR